jgi:copper transport protein
MNGRLSAALAGLVLGVIAVFAAPAAPAAAHAALLRSDPPAGEIVDAPPREVVLTFSEAVRLVPGKTRAVGPDGKRVDSGEATIRGSELHVPLRSTTARGTYLVSYRVISADSHPVGGGVTFSVGAPSATPSATDNAARTDRLVATLLGVAHYLGYAGLVLLVGPVVALSALWPRRLSRRGPVRMVYVGVGLIVLGAAAELFLEAPYTAGVGLFGGSADDLRGAFASTYGAAHLVRLAAIAAVAVLLRPFLIEGPKPPGTADRALLAVLAVVGLATWPMSGHAGASSLPEVTAIADVAHLGAMSLWLGGLVVLVGFLLGRADRTELAAILPVWSNWATTAVGVLVVAGTVQALVEIGTFGALFGTTYGRLVLVKVGLLAVVLAAAYAARRIARNPDRARDAVRPLRRSVVVEVVTTAVVLAMSATLVQTTPARTARTAADQQAPSSYSATLTSPLYSLQVDIAPALVGYSIHLFAYTPEGAPLTVLEWQATAALPAKGIEPLTVPLLRITDNHATGDLQVPEAGIWEVRFTLRVSEIDEASVTAKVPVRN